MNSSSIKHTATILATIAWTAAWAQAPQYEFERMWPTLPQPWYFKRPAGVAADAAGNFYVGDTFNFRVHKYTVDGQLISIFGNAPGQFVYPSGMTIDGAGNVYVASGDGVVKYDRFGNELAFFETREQGGEEKLLTPSAVAVDDERNFYVVSQEFYIIQKYTTNGALIRQWGVGERLFDNAVFRPGIAVGADGSVYVADLRGAQSFIRKFTLDGDCFRHPETNECVVWSGGQPGQSDFFRPFGITTDDAGNVYIAIDQTGVIQVFDRHGTFLREFPRPDDPSRLSQPEGVALDGVGNVYAAEAGASRIQKFTNTGVFLAQWGSIGSGPGEFVFPQAVALDDDGAVYVADTELHRIQVFTPEGRFAFAFGEEGREDGQLVRPQGIAVDVRGGQGVIFVADTGTHRIQKFRLEGTSVEFVAKWGSDNSGNDNTAGHGPGELFGPLGLALDSEGLLYVADSRNARVQVFTQDGEYVREWGAFSDVPHPNTVPGTFNAPHDVAIDAEDNVYVTDRSAITVRVQKFTRMGEFIRQWGRFGEGPGEFSEATGIDVDSMGRVYVADFHHDRVQAFTADGAFLTVIGGRGDDPGQFSQPAGVAVGPDDRLYVADTQHSRVQCFAPSMTALKQDARARKAVLVAGGGPGNALWPVTQMLANVAYRTLLHQGFARDAVHYLTPDLLLDLDNNLDTIDVAGDATAANLETALTDWAADAGDVLLYLTGPGTPGVFRINAGESVSAGQLRDWLDALQSLISGGAVVVYDASFSGSFLLALEPASPRERIVITSTTDDEEAFFLTQGTLSFSYHFWNALFNGRTIEQAFAIGEEAMNGAAGYQRPLYGRFEGPVRPLDKQRLSTVKRITRGVNLFDTPPVIGVVSPAREVAAGVESLDFFAEGVMDDQGDIGRVWAIVTGLDAPSDGLEGPVLSRPTFDFSPAGARFEATFDEFRFLGEYRIDVYALDNNLNISRVQQTSVTKGIIPASIVGRVLDEAGAVQGATIELLGAATISIATDAAGLYQFVGIDDGAYTVRALAANYEPQERAAIMQGGAGKAVNFLLKKIGEGEGEGEGDRPRLCAATPDGGAHRAADAFLIAAAVALASVLRRARIDT